MPDLKYETQKMRETATKYREVAADLTSIKDNLTKQLTDLKNTDWQSDAGKEFQNMYDDGWTKNVNKYVDVLKEMATQLDNAANEYDTVTEKLKKIDGVTI